MKIKNKEDVISRLCKLSTLVMEKQFKYQNPADCFCTTSNNSSFEFDEEVLEFIEQSVKDKLSLNGNLDSEDKTKTFFYTVRCQGTINSGIYLYNFEKYSPTEAHSSLTDYLNTLYGTDMYTLTGFNTL